MRLWKLWSWWSRMTFIKYSRVHSMRQATVHETLKDAIKEAAYAHDNGEELLDCIEDVDRGVIPDNEMWQAVHAKIDALAKAWDDARKQDTGERFTVHMQHPDGKWLVYDTVTTLEVARRSAAETYLPHERIRITKDVK